MQLLRQAIGWAVDGASEHSDKGTMHDDIEAIVQLAMRQSTGPLVFTQLLRTLPPTPSLIGQGSLEMQMKQLCMQNMLLQEEMKTVLTKTIDALSKGGVQTTVMKGFSLAQLYPNPHVRQWGDIDIYVGNNGYHKAAAILKNTWPDCPCFETEEDFFKHWNINVGHTAIEAHRISLAMTHPRDKRIWTRLEKEGLVTQSKEITIDGVSIRVPEDKWNVLLVLIHSWHHYTESRSANMKQVCDVAMCLKALGDRGELSGDKKRITEAYLKTNLRKLHLTQVWEVYAYIMVKYLGVSEEYVGCNVDKVAARGELFLERLLVPVRPIHTATDKKVTNVIVRKLGTLKAKIASSMTLYEIAPRYVLHAIVGQVLEGMGRLLQGEINRKWE